MDAPNIDGKPVCGNGVELNELGLQAHWLARAQLGRARANFEQVGVAPKNKAEHELNKATAEKKRSRPPPRKPSSEEMNIDQVIASLADETREFRFVVIALSAEEIHGWFQTEHLGTEVGPLPRSRFDAWRYDL